MKFLVDENISKLVRSALQDAGFDVAALAPDQRGSTDPVVLALAATEGRIVITEDRDFGELVIRKRLPVAGILMVELEELSNASEAERVLAVVLSLKDGLLGHLVVVEPSRTRIRPLPSGPIT
jgi:predicted nuclease of predicted toxin-antitoxin system